MKFFTRNKQEKKSFFKSIFFSDFEQNYIGLQNSSEFIKTYIDACPVFTATRLIADAVSSINIVLQDKNADFIYDHEALTLLRNPNPFTDGQLFLKEITSFFILTGNNYINIIGEKKPVEINNLKPQDITIQAGNDGYAGEYNYSSYNYNSIYKRDINKRFIDQRKNELIHLRDFNPLFSSTNLFGSSMFLGCQLEIAQYVEAGIHNYSLIKNGARPSGIISYKGTDTISAEQVDGIMGVIRNKLRGAKNAGEPAFLNGDFVWQPLSQTTKDMDFQAMKKSVSEAIYSAVKIPLPMVSPDNMSFANMDASKYIFYDNAVLPILKRILSFLTQKLLSRYPNAQGLKFAYDESTIEALQIRKFETAKLGTQIGSLTDNEIRAIIGYEALIGGDTLYKPQNLIPSGQDNYTADNRDQPVGKSEFIRIMQEQKKLDGSKLYHDEYIKLKAKEYYGNWCS